MGTEKLALGACGSCGDRGQTFAGMVGDGNKCLSSLYSNLKLEWKEDERSGHDRIRYLTR